MIVPILKYGSPVLRKHSVEISEVDYLLQIVEDLSDTLKKEGGLGLTGPQIGIQKRIFLIDTSSIFEDDPTVERIEQVFINPEIIEFSTEAIHYKEGCLSIPGIYESVQRPVKIKVSYQDTFLNTIEKELDGIQARIFQHEFDHLNGILFIDRLSSLRRKLLTGKLNKIRNL
jgi:peptide deformylase